MKVFISWSGERSRQVAELLDDWIQCVIQAVDPWLSSKDIDRGALWFTEINNQLSDVKIGIVCLTQQNKDKPWILFESGALAKGLSSNRVCTFLIDLETTDIANPLAQFNHTFPKKDSIYELVRTINLILNEKGLKDDVLTKVFETYYPQFEKKFKQIIKDTPEEEIKTKRKGDDIMIEVLSSVRMLERRLRNIENSDFNNNSTMRDNSEFTRAMSSKSLKQNIIELIEQDLPPEIIVDVLSRNNKIPKSVIKREIDRAFNTKNHLNGE
jgi:hypothetical protein